MSQIVPQSFQPHLTPQESYDIVNAMAIDYLQFAIYSHYYHRLFGVKTDSEEGTDGTVDRFTVNNCLREAVWTTLYAVQSQTEAILGYNLSPRYHTETVPVGASYRVKTRYPGLESVDVVPQITVISDEDVTEVPISPFVQEDVPVSLVGNVGTVTISKDVIFNPSDAIIRSADDGGAISVSNSGGYPRRDVNGDWVVLLNSHEHALTNGELVNIQSRRFMFVDVDPIVTEVGETAHPVFSGTVQKIPLARPVERTSENKDRYWFYAYTLVDPAFFLEMVDLVKGDFYKLVQTVDFRKFYEATSPALAKRVTPTDCNSCDDTEWRLDTRIIDAEKGIVEFDPVGVYRLVDGVRTYIPKKYVDVPFSNVQKVFVTFSYKTNPIYLPQRAQQDIPLIRRAIMHRVAAELPVTDCGCTTTGFIGEQQKAYQTATQLSNGAIISDLKYGSLHGQAVYAEMMRSVTLLNTHIV